VTGELPRVEVKPVVGDFNLVSINDFLLENSVAVTKSVAPGWVVQGSQTVEETGSQTTKTTIPEGSVMLLADNVLNPKAKVGETI
jgi:hypothetical protein